MYKRKKLLFFGLALGIVSLFLTSCSPGLPSDLQGRWKMNLLPNNDQVFLFRSHSVEFDYISYGSITSTWTEKVTKVFTTSAGVNIILTDGVNDYAWYVDGSTLYLDWGVQESQLESLSSNWWKSNANIYTKY